MELKTIYKELKMKTYTDEKKRLDFKTGIWGYSVIRPLSFYFSAFFLKIKMTANQISFIGLIMLFFSFYYFYIGKFIWGAILINAYYLSDCIDGNMARFKIKKSNMFGEILDSVVGLIYCSFIYFFVGLGIFLESGDLIYIILGSMTSIFVILRRCFSLRVELILKKNMDKIEKSKIEKIQYFQLAVRWIFELQDLGLLLLAIYSNVKSWIYFVFIYNFITLFFNILLKLFQLYKEDKKINKNL